MQDVRLLEARIKPVSGGKVLMMMPGFSELIVIAIILLLLFGPGKLTGVGKSLGTAISEFKDALKEEKNKDKNEDLPKE